MRASPISLVSLLLVSCAANSAPSALESSVQEESPVAYVQWAIDLDRSALIDQAVSSSHQFFELNEGSKSKVNLFIDPELSEERQKKVSELAELTVRVFDGYIHPTVDVLVGKYPEFMTATVEANDIVNRGNGRLCGYELSREYVSGCAYQNAFWFGFGNQSDLYESVFQIVPHEMFHNVQFYLHPNSVEDDSNIPGWFIEGNADFFGYSIFEFSGLGKYEIFTEDYWYYLPDPKLGLAHFETRSVAQIPPEYYWMGQIATEYLVANVGVESVLSIWALMGEGYTFADAFENAVGTTLDDFYSTFDQMYEHLFSTNSTITTFENRECPEEWFCGEGQAGEWWQMLGAEFPLPEVAENDGHATAVSADRVDPPFASCDLMPFEFQLGVAASHNARASYGSNVPVSTQWYAQNNHLDTNLDGIACGLEDFD